MATYKIQIDDEVRNATAEETAQIDAQRAAAQAEAQAQAEAAETKAVARQALLARLGITEEEAVLLLGGN